MALAWMIGCTYGGTWHAVDIWKDANILPEKIRNSEVVFTCTKFNADHLKDIAGDSSDKVILSYHGLDFSRLPTPADFAPIDASHLPEIIAIGRLVPKKGFAYLIEAVAKLAREKFPVHLTIVGDGPLESELKRSVESFNLQDHVEFTGSLKNAETLERVNRAHLLVAPSIQDKYGNIDGIPNVTLEAMALARPVVGTRLSGIPEVVNENTGALVECADVDGLATAIRSLLSDRDGLIRRGKNAQEFVYSHFDVHKNIEIQLNRFAEILSSK
jgi:glycosyltransferase involved in cell wall biosynthesis